MKKLLASLLSAAMIVAAVPTATFAATRMQTNGEIGGMAVVEGKPLASITVRLRNVDSGRLVGTTTTNAAGEFKFQSLPVGNYVVETIAPNGTTILGTSPRIALVAGAMVATGLTVSTSAAAAAAAGLTGAAGAAGAAGGAAGAGAAGAGAAGGAAGAAAAGGAFFATTAGIITAVAVGAGVTAAVVATTNNASASGG
ncbi:MAG: SdrD B-like domain-containing protein [Vicinamibacterales bacterium]